MVMLYPGVYDGQQLHLFGKISDGNYLENAQPVFTEVPMVMLYPGVYDGQQLHLFGKISDGNYYRAFSLL